MGRLAVYLAILYCYASSLSGIMALEAERKIVNMPSAGQPNIAGQVETKQNSGIVNAASRGSLNAFGMRKNYGKSKSATLAAWNKKTDVPLYDLQASYDLEFGDCGGFDILAFNTTEFAGQKMDDVHQCAEVCNSLPDCKLFLWLLAPEFDVPLCLPKNFVCPRRQHEGDPNYMLFIKKKPNAELAKQQQTFVPAPSTLDNSFSGYRKELNCRILDVAAGGAQKRVKTSEGCAQLCNRLASCDGFIWLTAAIDDSQAAGDCLLQRWSCPTAPGATGMPGYLYIKEAIYSKLQRDTPLQQPPRSLECKDAYFTCPEDDPTSTSYRPPAPQPNGWQRLPLEGPGQTAEGQPSLQEPARFEKRMRQKEQGNKLVQKT